MNYFIGAFIAFIIGSIPFSYIVGYAYGKTDIRTIGSKNAGAGNVFHLYGIRAGLLALAGDMGKGALAAWLLSFLFHFKPYALTILGVFSVLGHVFTPFLKFRGGKGAATTAGLLLFVILYFFKIKGLYVLLILVPAWLLLLLITHSQVVSIAVLFPFFPFVLYAFSKDTKLLVVNAVFVVLLEILGRKSFAAEAKKSYEKYLRKLFKRAS